MIIETKKGSVDIDETMRSSCIKDHIKSKKIETPEDWQEAKKQAEAIKTWWDTNNGKFKATESYEEGFAIHHAQVAKGKPYNFFVLDKQFTGTEIKKEDRRKRDIKNKIFPAQIIYNPEIITALQTFLDYTPDPNPKRKWRKSAIPNVMVYQEACMSYPHRKPKNYERFYKIKVRYQVVKKKMLGLKEEVETVEEEIEGLKAHIFQHEVDHANGFDIHFGDGKKKDISVEEREIEEGYTRAEVEAFTYEKMKELSENIMKQGVSLIEELSTGAYYRIKNKAGEVEMPKGFAEVDNFELYNWDGTIKPPHNKAPLYGQGKSKVEKEKKKES